jgi:hypothetical protein
VISRQFNEEEAARRLDVDGINATDNDGLPLVNEEDTAYLEVAHIVPHALASSDKPSNILVRFLSSSFSVFFVFYLRHTVKILN